MSRSRLGRSIDNVVISIALSLLFFVLYKTFIPYSLLALALSVITSFFIMLLIISHQNKRFEELKIEKSELKKIEKQIFELRKLSAREQLDFFFEMLKSENPERHDDFLVINNLLFAVKLHESEIKDGDLFQIYSSARKNKNINEIVVVINKVDENVQKLAKLFDIKFTFFTPLETYALEKKYNHFIEVSEAEQKKQRRLNIDRTFVKSRAKVFIKFGLLLYLLAVFVPFTKYYLIFSSLFLFIGIIFLLFGQKDTIKAPQNQLLSSNK